MHVRSIIMRFDGRDEWGLEQLATELGAPPGIAAQPHDPARPRVENSVCERFSALRTCSRSETMLAK